MSRLGRGFPAKPYIARANLVAPATYTAVVAVGLVDARTTSGTRQTMSASAVALTDTVTTAGTRKALGVSTVALTDSRVTSGTRKTTGATATALVANRTTAGRRTILASAVVALTDVRTTAGARRTTSATTVALTDTVATSGGLKLLGATAVALTATITTAGTRTGSFPATGVLDNFNRTDGAIGSNWASKPENTNNPLPTIVSNAATPALTGQTCSAKWVGGTFGPDYEVYATLGRWTTDDVLTLLARITDTGTAGFDSYRLQLTTTSGVTILDLRRATNGTLASISGGAQNIDSLQAGDVVGLRVEGATISAFRLRAGVFTVLWSAVDTAPLAASTTGLVGFEVFNATAGFSVDDLGGGTYVSALVGTKVGATATTLTVAGTTAGQRTTTSSTSTSQVATVATLGRRIGFGAVTVTETDVRTTAGRVGVRSSSTTPLVATVTSTGRTVRLGSSQVGLTAAIATQGARLQFGTVTVGETAQATVAGLSYTVDSAAVLLTATVFSSGTVGIPLPPAALAATWAGSQGVTRPGRYANTSPGELGDAEPGVLAGATAGRIDG